MSKLRTNMPEEACPGFVHAGWVLIVLPFYLLEIRAGRAVKEAVVHFAQWNWLWVWRRLGHGSCA